MSPTLQETLTDWRNTIGDSRVVTSSEALHVIGTNETVTLRQVSAILKPSTIEQVKSIVCTANKRHIPLYPVSRGCNWGYGAATPVTADCVVLDLSGLDRTIDFDAELGVVTIEPGVTPKQLREFLDQKKAPYLVPVCGAGPDHSIIGNALERGYGVTPHADHFGAVMSLKAVLPNGDLYESALTAAGGEEVNRSFKWGVGPYLDGIFTQANLGIVVEMTIALSPIPQHVECFIISLPEDSLVESAVEAVRDTLKQLSGVSGSINLMNAQRVLAMVEKYPRNNVPVGGIMPDSIVKELLAKNRLSVWTVGGVLYGDVVMVRHARKLIKKRFAGVASRQMFFTRGKIDFLKRVISWLPGRKAAELRSQFENLDESFKVAEGAPSEIALPLCYWKSGHRPPVGQSMNPARDGCGVIWYSPLVPAKPEVVRAYVGMVRSVCIEHGIEPLITLTSLSHRCFDSTIPILFDPQNADETASAKRCYRALFAAGKEQGWIPYRYGIDHMDLIVDADKTFWKTVAAIKNTLDPNGIISPGRYCPLNPEPQSKKS